MARHKLENELIAIEVEEHGAELKSLVRKNTGKEYMWKADPKFWGRTSPVLFPFVGAVKEKQFRTKVRCAYNFYALRKCFDYFVRPAFHSDAVIYKYVSLRKFCHIRRSRLKIVRLCSCRYYVC